VPLPVLTVHPTDAERPPRFATILVGVDFSEESALAVQTAARVALHGAGRGRIVLLHASYVPVPLAGLQPPIPAALNREKLELEARARLETIAAGLRSDRLEVDVRVHQAYAVDAILRETSTAKPDLIAVGTRGRSRLNRLFMGSVAERVVHLAPCPVLTVRSDDQA
jgi:nucleotide-binding universal stress UspA family protein